MLWIRIIFFFLGLPWNVQANRKWQFQWEGANFITKASTLRQNHSEIIEPIKTCANGHVSHRTVSFFQNQLIQLDSRLPKFHSHILIRLHWCFRSLGGVCLCAAEVKDLKTHFFSLKNRKKINPPYIFWDWHNCLVLSANCFYFFCHLYTFVLTKNKQNVTFYQLLHHWKISLFGCFVLPADIHSRGNKSGWCGTVVPVIPDWLIPSPLCYLFCIIV